jgi:hypothetical protein
MTARIDRPLAEPAGRKPRRVIDLTKDRVPDPRMAEYEQAFGLPSALHHHTLPEVVAQRGLVRLLSLVTGRARH